MKQAKSAVANVQTEELNEPALSIQGPKSYYLQCIEPIILTSQMVPCYEVAPQTLHHQSITFTTPLKCLETLNSAAINKVENLWIGWEKYLVSKNRLLPWKKKKKEVPRSVF